jgi:hypothetical protein
MLYTALDHGSALVAIHGFPNNPVSSEYVVSAHASVNLSIVSEANPPNIFVRQQPSIHR